MSKERFANLLYKHAILPVTSFDPEATHDLLFKVFSRFEKSDLFLKAVKQEFGIEDRKLVVEMMGIEFPSTILLAAGIVKYGPGACIIAAMGAGGEDIGTFTFQKTDGNPKVETFPDGRKVKVKRIRRFPDGTIVNWMGLPNLGTEKGVENIKNVQDKICKPFGFNLAPTPGLGDIESSVADLRQSLEIVYRIHPSWNTLNLHCPNTLDSEKQKRIDEAVQTMRGFAKAADTIEARTGIIIPKIAKIGPDMTPEDIKLIVLTAKECNFQAIKATNTTTDRTGEREKYAAYKGGLSGPLLFERSLSTMEQVTKFDRELGGDPLVKIACGGIGSFDKLKKIQRAGADLFECATPFIFGGPYFWKRMNRDYLNSFRI